jgi:hypothetical protein
MLGVSVGLSFGLLNHRLLFVRQVIEQRDGTPARVSTPPTWPQGPQFAGISVR